MRRTGIGPARASSTARALGGERGDALAVLGFCGALEEDAAPGEVVVAEEVLAAADEGHGSLRVSCDGVRELTRALREEGLRVRQGEIVCVSKIAVGERRSQLRAAGAIAVDMESVWLAEGAAGRPFGVVRVVLDSPSHELLSPRAPLGALRAAAVLRRVARVVWASGLGASDGAASRESSKVG